MKSQLNEYQRAAVLDDHPACLVNANVGSGKTTVLIEKILYLHRTKGVPYHKMVVLTFTNKAADEIKARLLLEEPDVEGTHLARFGTFHSIALAMLRDWNGLESLGYTREFLVMEPDEELDTALQLIEEHKLKIKYKNRLKKRLEELIEVTPEKREEKCLRYKDDILELVRLLEEEKKCQDKMTYYDIIHNAILMMQQMTPQERMELTPEWIIIDEVQDSDALQLALIEGLHGEKTKLFAVGDPNQVIYSWRGSALNVFFQLKKKYDAVELSLPINYRSSDVILEAARRFQQNGNELLGSERTGDKIVVRNHYNPFQEAGYLADKIRAQHEAGIPYHEIAIFYRLQDQAQLLLDVFEREGVPCEVPVKQATDDSYEEQEETTKEDIVLLDAVQLMTLHASKGLEFEQVYIIGVNYGLIPLRAKSMEEDDEERRLFFVGLTRAKKRLELSYYTSPDHYGAMPGESRYLRLIPQELMEREGAGGDREPVDLHDLKRQIMQEQQNRQEQPEEQQVQQQAARKVMHPRYGKGTVIAEDEQMITVDFGALGEREFLRAFSELTDI